LVFIGCATNKTSSQNDIIGLTAENVPEGISLSFSHIPQNTTDIFIGFSEITKGKDFYNFYTDPCNIFTFINGASLDRIKQNNTIICPFVQAEQAYFVFVQFSLENNNTLPYLYTVIQAENGMKILNNVGIEINETQDGVRLSSLPEFSKTVQYDSNKYYYGITVRTSEYTSVGYGREIFNDIMTWEFLPKMIVDINGQNIQLNQNIHPSGELPVFATAYSSLIYNNQLWHLAIAASDEFIVSF
jgi:hypothetical protein